MVTRQCSPIWNYTQFWQVPESETVVFSLWHVSQLIHSLSKFGSLAGWMSHQFLTAPYAVSPPKPPPPAARFSPSFSLWRTSWSSCTMDWFFKPLSKSFFANSSASLDIFMLSFRGGELCMTRNLLWESRADLRNSSAEHDWRSRIFNY